MSNTQVGGLYQEIMKQVVEQSQITFEEEGVEPSVLEELRMRWQKHLSARQCATMPWDPQPVPAAPQPSTIPSNASRSQPQPLPSAANSSAPSQASSEPNSVHIKAEPGTGFNLNSLPVANQAYSSQAALQRAGQQLQEKFGAAAAPQINHINQMTQRAAMLSQNNHAAARPMTRPPQQPQSEEQRRQYMQAQRQYQQSLHQAQQQQRAAAAVQNGNSQTDGPSDWSAFAAQRRAEAQNPYEADMTIRQQLAQASREMEGGGIMLPLSQIPNTVVPKKRKTMAADPAQSIPQLDGRGDSDEDDKTGIIDDEDAINSDLDDPDDNVVDETEDDDNQGEVMVCTYDKVQRVKNKWKCTLKDGVLTTGGREYVFHKATGEFEW